MEKDLTDCCAIAFLSGLHNRTTVKELQQLINNAKDLLPKADDPIEGATCFLASTAPSETALRKTLVETGFLLVNTMKQNTYHFEYDDSKNREVHLYSYNLL